MDNYLPYIKIDNAPDEDVIIFNKTTIDIIFAQENPADMCALYCFYYKTAKWQKTNSIKATDSYITKCLGWGNDRITKTKNRLKELGLITILQRRNKGKIDGWYVQVGYIVSKEKVEKVVKLLEEATLNQNSSKPEVVHQNSSQPEVADEKHMLKENNNNMLKENNNNIYNNNARVCDSYIANPKEPESIIKWDLIKPELLDSFKPLIEEFIQYRKESKKPMSIKAINIFINRLLKYSNENINIATQLIEEAILKNWQSIYEPKPNQYSPQSKESNGNKGSAPSPARPVELALTRFKSMKFGEEWKNWHGGLCTYDDINAVFESNGIQLAVDDKFLVKFQEFFDCYNKLNKSIDIAGYVVPEDHFKKPEKFRDRLIAPTTYTSYSFDSWLALYVEYLKKKYPTIDKMYAGHFDIDGASFDDFVTSDWFDDQKIRTNDIGAKRHRYISLAEIVLKNKNND